jgi:hypothetical protein
MACHAVMNVISGGGSVVQFDRLPEGIAVTCRYRVQKAGTLRRAARLKEMATGFMRVSCPTGSPVSTS